jgi:uncharacterized membrane protein YdbT with pleckstrin-like domain
VLKGAIYGGIGVTIAAVSGWWRWDNTRWWVTADGIHRKSGLITKRTDVPFTRVQALDLEQGLVQRWFGVHSVHVQTGGGGADGEIVLRRSRTRTSTRCARWSPRRRRPRRPSCRRGSSTAPTCSSRR